MRRDLRVFSFKRFSRHSLLPPLFMRRPPFRWRELGCGTTRPLLRTAGDERVGDLIRYLGSVNIWRESAKMWNLHDANSWFMVHRARTSWTFYCRFMQMRPGRGDSRILYHQSLPHAWTFSGNETTKQFSRPFVLPSWCLKKGDFLPEWPH